MMWPNYPDSSPYVVCEFMRGDMREKKSIWITILFFIIVTISGCSGSDHSASLELGGTGTSGKIVSATLTWDAPTTRTDGTSLDPATDILEYTIYYRSSTGILTHMMYVSNPGTTIVTHSFSIAQGAYHIMVTATDNYSQESARSPEIIKTF